jgi:hypothetical protein
VRGNNSKTRRARKYREVEKKQDVFDKHELAFKKGIYKDPRWVQVRSFRKKGKHLEANGLVLSIREDYVEGGY